MAPTHLQPDEAGTADTSGMRKGLRLGDAERIAAERLDGAAEGSLKEALAVTPPGETDPPAPAVDREPADATDQMAVGIPNGAQAVVPLAGALDAAVKLAADANAAAEALESLRRLFERQLPNAAGGAEAPAAVAATVTPPPVPLRPSGDPGGLSSLEPAAAASPTPQTPPTRTLPVPSPSRAPVERRHLDIRGFLAGFALSWAIGMVLYLFMAAG